MAALIRNIFLILLTFSFSNAGFAENEGPQTGGGGHTIFVNGQPILIDFFNSPDYLSTLRTIEGKYSYRLNPQLNNLSPSINFHLSLSEQLMVNNGILTESQLLNQQTRSAENSANIKITKALWKTLPVLPMNSAPFYKPRYLPASLPVDIKLTAYYDSFFNAVYLNKAIWDGSPFATRLGLVVHERLRLLQYSFDFLIDDEFLQKMTLTLLTCPPDQGLGQLIQPRFPAEKISMPFVQNHRLFQAKLYLQDRLSQCLQN